MGSQICYPCNSKVHRPAMRVFASSAARSSLCFSTKMPADVWEKCESGMPGTLRSPCYDPSHSASDLIVRSLHSFSQWSCSLTCVPPAAQIAISSAPQFLIGVQLGKGGFGQVFKGSRAYPRATKDPSKPMQVRLQHKFAASCCHLLRWLLSLKSR